MVSRRWDLPNGLQTEWAVWQRAGRWDTAGLGFITGVSCMSVMSCSVDTKLGSTANSGYIRVPPLPCRASIGACIRGCLLGYHSLRFSASCWVLAPDQIVWWTGQYHNRDTKSQRNLMTTQDHMAGKGGLEIGGLNLWLPVACPVGNSPSGLPGCLVSLLIYMLCP